MQLVRIRQSEFQERYGTSFIIQRFPSFYRDSCDSRSLVLFPSSRGRDKENQRGGCLCLPNPIRGAFSSSCAMNHDFLEYFPEYPMPRDVTAVDLSRNPFSTGFSQCSSVCTLTDFAHSISGDTPDTGDRWSKLRARTDCPRTSWISENSYWCIVAQFNLINYSNGEMFWISNLDLPSFVPSGVELNLINFNVVCAFRWRESLFWHHISACLRARD